MEKVSGAEKCRWKEVEEKRPKDSFVDQMLTNVETFRSHVQRVQTQYREIRGLREILLEGEVLLRMDFAENYTSSSLEEVQSAYWNASMVSLHGCVLSWEPEPKKLAELCYRVIHNATTIYTTPPRQVSTETNLWNAVTVLCGQLDCDDDTS